jgi:nitrogen fixation/metabolism regulation signal transduction histidine kinase
MIAQEKLWTLAKWISYILLGVVLNLAGIKITNKYFWIIITLALCIELASIWHINSKLYRLVTDADDNANETKNQVSDS